MSLLTSIPFKLNLLLTLATWVAHWLGKFLVIAIFLIASSALINEICLSFGLKVLSEKHWLFVLSNLVYNEKAWAPATAVVATTVAMGHFRTLEVNIDKENRERDSARTE
ncbi:hypothetical protein BCU33_019295 [Vibrio lentus]|uniref:hypothetical protein n=1 Tax=Vibrio lentus TaxID=136468 RepID=UPI000C829E4F|nr:hypothetical protein [Vibrio lentus]PMI97074.1 hypothetical protein BCU33_03990 [Vibrio lentus]